MDALDYLSLALIGLAVVDVAIAVDIGRFAIRTRATPAVAQTLSFTCAAISACLFGLLGADVLGWIDLPKGAGLPTLAVAAVVISVPSIAWYAAKKAGAFE